MDLTWLKSVVASMLFIALWVVVVPFWLLGAHWPPPAGWTLYLGGILFVAGLGLGGICVFDFARHGHGTPAPMDPPRRLVIAGPYRWVRNPMYVGLVVGLLGEALALHSVAVAALALAIALVVTVFVARFEEPALERKFGADYVAYKRQVHRWIPRPPS